MNGLEQRLHALGREVAFPPEPNLAPAVVARLGRRPFPWRRAAVVAFAVLAVAVAAAFAVPQARTAILRFFHLRGATVERVETLPPAQARAGLGRGRSRSEAERELGFRLALPPNTAPGRVYVLDRALATVALRENGRLVLLSEFRAADFDVLKKLVTSATIVEPAAVDGDPGLWIEGAPHTLTYLDRSGRFRERTVLISGNVLLWTHRGLTLRLEGHLTKQQALGIAREIG